MIRELRLLGIVLLSFSISVQAQSILVEPFLQNLKLKSISVVWETDSNDESILYYGLTPVLGDSVIGSVLSTSDATRIHSAKIEGIDPSTRYYYKAKTGAWESEVFDFVTPAIQGDEEGFRMIAMSDMQKDGSNPLKFQEVVNSGILPYVDSVYGPTLTDEIGMVIIPGDLVSTGSNWSHWRNDFFGQSNPLFSHIPLYPVLGNHEQNAAQYFDYFIMPENGTPSFEEHWWYKDYSNVRVIGLNSNSGYRIQAQLDWLDETLALACSDEGIDFVFLQLHHPYKSELWTPGETSWVGQVIELMENFSTDCGKPSIHFFGHTHGYSRGQSRDHDHVWVNVATAGGAIDHWGDYPQADYDEFVITQDEYGFVMVEITAGENPQFLLKRISIGDDIEGKPNTTEDVLSVRRYNTPPASPLPMFPMLEDTISPTCFTLKADEFVSADGDSHGSSQWQIAVDSNGFDAPIVDEWRQVKNWYNEVNTQEGDDLTDHETGGLSGNSDYWWRVRYRDSGLAWSDWTTPSKFHTSSSSNLVNLVQNPGAESGIVNWTVEIGVLESLGNAECGGEEPHGNSLKYFAIGALCVEFDYATAYQDIDVSTYSAMIDTGEAQVNFGAYLSDWSGSDIPQIAIEYFDGGLNLLGSSDTLSGQQDPWELKEDTEVIPPMTRTIRFHMMGTRVAGADNDSYVDDIFCRIGEMEDLVCDAYIAPGPLHNRLYVDENAVGIPNGDSWIKAYRNLSDALAAVDSTTQEIWVASGTYMPTQSNDRSKTFLIADGLKVFGGFSGIEVNRSERNTILNQTILSGEIGDTSLSTDNTYHLITVSNAQDSVVIDGFTIEGGYAVDAPISKGAGISVNASNSGEIFISNCTLQFNSAEEGAASHFLSDAQVLNCAFNNNFATSDGHSILNDGSTLIIRNVEIHQMCSNCGAEVLNINSGTIDHKGTLTIYKQ